MYYSLFFSSGNYLCYYLKAISLCLRSTAKSIALVVLKFGIHGQSYIPKDVHFKEGLTQEFIGIRKTNILPFIK